MNLEEYCNKLSEAQRLALAIKLIRTAMPVWDKFSGKSKLTYRDSVVWLNHEIDKDLLSNVVGEIESSLSIDDDIENLRRNEKLSIYFQGFSDPMIALQDDDWKLPDAPLKLFYAVYNLLAALMYENEFADLLGLSINQAIDSIECSKLLSEVEIRKLLV